jgi:hypothetical protein
MLTKDALHESIRMPCEWISPGTVVINVAAQPNVCEDSVLAIPGVRYVPKIGASFRVELDASYLRSPVTAA